VAATSKWVPVNSAEMMSVAISPDATTVGQGERPQAPANSTSADGASGRDLVRFEPFSSRLARFSSATMGVRR
jgi:hypothetical protein